MTTSKEIVAELRRLGYTGPVSYGKPKLLDILFQTTHAGNGSTPTAEAATAASEALEPAAEAPASEVRAIPQALKSESSQCEWLGLKKDDLVHVAGYPGWRFKFQSYEDPPGKKPYVVVKATRRKQTKMRYFHPEQICHVKTKKPLLNVTAVTTATSEESA